MHALQQPSSVLHRLGQGLAGLKLVQPQAELLEADVAVLVLVQEVKNLRSRQAPSV